MTFHYGFEFNVQRYIGIFISNLMDICNVFVIRINCRIFIIFNDCDHSQDSLATKKSLIIIVISTYKCVQCVYIYNFDAESQVINLSSMQNVFRHNIMLILFVLYINIADRLFNIHDNILEKCSSAVCSKFSIF